jgi:hypothetical protein
VKVIYKLAQLNGKIYGGKDATGTLNYFCSLRSRIIETG